MKLNEFKKLNNKEQKEEYLRIKNKKEKLLTIYKNRCESDVEINSRLFHHQMDYNMKIYNNVDEVLRLYNYITFKIECLKEQEEEGIKLNIDLAEKSKYKLEKEIEQKINNLSFNMPKIVKKKAPKNMYNKNGELSVIGTRWKNLLKSLNLSEDDTVIYELGNPGSPIQLKNWLLGLGWKPITFKISKNTGEKLPQISLPFGGGLCHSVKDLLDEHTYLKDLKGLYKSKHRFGVFKSFLANVDISGKIYSTAHGFSNTLRILHSKPVVNLPSIDKYYGKEIRGCLTVPNNNYIMCGSDISGLESATAQHYIYKYDPDYVRDMRTPGYDPHIDIGILAGLITLEEKDFYNNYNSETASEKDKVKYNKIKLVRFQSKTINFAAIYGAGPPKIAETLKCDLKFAEKLHKTYWDRNSAVKDTANSCIIKDVETLYYISNTNTTNTVQKWLYNPISGFWLFLKADKDKFSTLNQGSGVTVFDFWLKEVRKSLKPLGIKVIMQYHDEILTTFKKEYKDDVETILKEAMIKTNKKLKLNVSVGISIDTGNNYSETH